MKVRAGSAAIDQMPWRIPVNPDAPVEPLDADGVDRIHKTAMRILRDIGIEFLNPDAVEHLRRAGCVVNGTNVRMDEDFVMEMVGRAPETFTITPRNPDHELIMGGRHMLFVNVSSPPNAWDLERGKRSGDGGHAFAPRRQPSSASRSAWCSRASGRMSSSRLPPTMSSIR